MVIGRVGKSCADAAKVETNKASAETTARDVVSVITSPPEDGHCSQPTFSLFRNIYRLSES
jgi:hypothetical protein